MKRKILLWTLGLLGLIKLDAQVTSKSHLPQSLQNGLMAFYPFSGNTNDVSGYANDIVNSGAVLVPDQAGHPASAYRFNGTDSYMSIPYSDALNVLADNFTISFWFKNNKPLGHSGMHLFHRANANLAIGIGGDNKITFANQGYSVLMLTNQVFDNQWYHIVFSREGQTKKLFVNGVLNQTEINFEGLSNAASVAMILGYAGLGGNAGAYRLEGDLSQIMWYNRILSDSEVTSLYNLGSGLSCLNTNNFTINPFADTTVLRDSGAILDAGANFTNYTWSTGATTQTITPETSGFYKVTVTTSDGCVASDSTQLYVQQFTLNNKDTTICFGDNIDLNLKSLRTPVLTRYDFDDCTLSGFEGNGEGSLSVGNNGKNGCGITLVRPATAHSVKSDYGYGTYTVFAKAGSGVANQYFGALDGQLFMDSRPSGTDDVGYGIYYGNTRVLNSYSHPANAANWYSLKLRYTPDSIKFWIADNLVYEALVPFQLAVKTGSILVSTYDVSLYDEFTYEPYTDPNAVTTIQWSTGETSATINVAPQQTTSYTVEVNENGYVWKDTVQVDVSTISASFNPFADTLRVCSDSIVLDAGEGYTSYLWNTGDTAQLLSVSKTGNFNLSVQNEFGCKATDQVLVSITKAAVLENDTTICLGASITLHKSGKTIGSNHNNLPNHLKNGLVAYYPFNGNANDESGYSNNGSVNGAQLSTDRFGSSNSAYHFNGSSDFITCTSVPQVNNLSNFTMSAWIKLEGWNTNTNCNSGCAQFILSRDADNNSPAHFALVSGEAPGYEVLGGNIRQGTTDGTAYTSNNYAFPHTNWHLVTMTLGDGLVKLYVDGTLMVTNTCSHSTGSTSAPLLIGRNAKSDYPYFVNGNIDDVMLYSRTLSSDEVLELFNLNDTQQEWSTGEIADSITVSPQSDTTYYFTVSNGISTCVDSVKVYVQDLSKYNSLTDSAYLVNGTLDLDAGSGYNNYSWNNGSTQRILTVNSPGLYTVQVSSNYGCNAKDSVSVFLRPEVKYIQRASPIDSITGLSTVTFIARFTKPVSNVDLADFSAYSSNNVQSVLSAISKIDDSTYTIALNSLTGTGALRLDLKSSGTGIQDLDGIDLSGGFTNGQSYWIDRDNPETSIQSKPSSITKNTIASFLFRSNEAPVRYETNVDGGGYALLSDSTQTINALSAGTHSISVRAIDAAGNTDTTPATYSWKIDVIAPSVSSINRQSPLDSVTNLTSLTWRVRFSEPVTGVDTSDFSLTAVSPAAGKLSAISKLSDSLYDLSATVSNNTGGSLRLDLKSSGTGITDSATNNISVGFTTGQRYTLTNVSIKCPANITVAAASGRCTQTVAFTGANAVTVTGVTNPVITYVPASGTAFNVGTRTVTATVKSGTTTVGTCSFTVTVTDSQLPTVSALTASSVTLAPADHTMKTINLTYTATDNCTTVTSVITVTSNEPDAGTGEGDLPGDIVIVNNKQVQLRAEKTPGSAARVYTITLTVKDAAGNTVVKTAEVRVVHEILTPGTGSCYPINSTVPFTGQYWDAAGLTHTATWTADATSISGTDVEPIGATNGRVSGSNRFTTAGVYKMKMNVRDSRNVTTFSDLNKGLSALITIFGNTGTYSYGGGCMDIPAGSVVAKPTVSGKASFGFTVSGTSATTGRGEVELDFRSGAWEFNTTTITNYTFSGAKLTMTGTGRVTGVTTSYNYTLTAIDGNHPLGGGTDKVRLRVTTSAGAVIFDNNPGALTTADPSMAVCTGLGQVYVPGGAAVGTLETPRESMPLQTQEKQPLSIKVSPNPSRFSFRIGMQSGSRESVTLKLTDLLGRLVEERIELMPNASVEIGQTLRPGIYTAEFYQGGERVVVKLVKE